MTKERIEGVGSVRCSHLAMALRREHSLPTGACRIAETHFAAVDIETTGFAAQTNRIVEVAVVHLEAASEPVVALDSLIRPDRRIGNRAVHGIGNRDVRKAPVFAEIAGSFCDAVVGRVLVAHNALFENEFLARELGLSGVRWPLPSICTMELHRTQHGGPANLESACAAADVPLGVRGFHQAREDALATARLLNAQLHSLPQGIDTLGDLASFGRTAVELDTEVLSPGEAASVGGRAPMLPRKQAPPRRQTAKADQETYEGALARALGGKLPSAEVEAIRGLQGNVTFEELAARNAMVFGNWLSTQAASGGLDSGQREKVRRALELLAGLGWAPGE